RLGYNCYHMQVVSREKGHVQAWTDLVNEKKPMDWKKLFKNYQATVDAPACFYYAELLNEFPDAKVVLTVRDPDRWYQSIMTLFNTMKPLRSIGYIIPNLGRFIRLVDSLSDKFIAPARDRKSFIEGYERHIRKVQETVPSDRLLVFRVKEGWEPLCAFLNCEIPKDTPFPHLNEGGATLKTKFRENFLVKPVRIVLIIAALLIVAALVRLLF
ncbi:MAG: sulfotransferase, partial [Proteobacteria bacterium]|nr:sulfotransferase [Pseudomonadota bacterium]